MTSAVITEGESLLYYFYHMSTIFMTSAVITEGEPLLYYLYHMSTISMKSAVITERESLFILFVSHVHNNHDISSNYRR